MKNYFLINCINDSVKVGDNVVISVVNSSEGRINATFKNGEFVGAVTKQIVEEHKKVSAKVRLVGISHNCFKAIAEAA